MRRSRRSWNKRPASFPTAYRCDFSRVARCENNQLDDAIAAYRQAISLQPGLWQAWAGLGITLRAKGQEEDAQRAFAEAKRLTLDFKIPPP